MESSFSDDTLLARWLSKELSTEEEQLLQDREDFADFDRIIRATDRLRPPAYDARAELARFRVNHPASGARPLHLRPRPARKLPLWYAAAAAVALLLSAWFFWPQNDLYFATQAGDTTMARLPDGSSARLNAVSTLDFQPDEHERLATLSGEAYFDVAKSEVPFIVKTDFGQVTVVGTTFNVYARDGEMRVSCTSGQVRVVFTGSPEAYPLLPGESVSSGTDGVQTGATDAAEALDWLEGRSVFVNRPLSEAFAELERQFDLSFEFPEGLDTHQSVRATFTHDDADRALDILVNTLSGIDYERNGKRVVLRYKN